MPHRDLEVRRAYHRNYMRRYNTPETPEQRETLRAQWRAWHERNKTRRNQGHRERIRALRLETLEAYGGLVCCCCGEDLEAFLTLDHVYNDGADERRTGYDGAKLWRKLRRENWPIGYQVLCYNCNNGKRVNNGVCPHATI